MDLEALARCDTFEDFCKASGATGKAALELLIIELNKLQELKRKKT